MFLQKLLTKANVKMIDYFLEEVRTVKGDFYSLMTDKYGNYFCQELLLSCSAEQRLSILTRIKPFLIEICMNWKGTHTIQKTIELSNLPAETEYFETCLTSKIAPLAIDSQGTHVIQMLMSSLPEENRQYVFQEILESFMRITKM